MRKAILLSLLFLSAVTFSQAPQFLNYQAVARDASGNIITTAIGVRFEILQGSASGTVVYDETNTIIPSSVGIFTSAIGSGVPASGPFSGINWANSPYFIRVGIDPTGGTSYSTVGTSQLLSVPYALYAEKAGNAQTVNISGPGVTGSYPNYTITPPGALTPSTGISISGGTITNTAPNQTVNITGANVIGAYPDYTITPASALTTSTGISIVSGTITNTAPDQTVTISGAVGTYPNFTVTPTPATSLTATGTSILITGTGPGFTIVPQPSLTLTGNQLSIADGNTVTLPTGTTYTSGVGISLGSGTVITNSLPDQTVTISNGTNVTVTGTYPNFVVNSTPTLSIGSGSISISGGNSVALPVAAPPTTVVAGTNVSVGGTGPTYTVNATPTLSIGSGSISISGGNSVALPVPAPTTVIAGSNITVGGTAPTYTVNTPTYSLNFSSSSTGLLTNGINSSAVSLPQPTLTVSGTNSNVISAGSNSITIPHYTAGNGLTLSGVAPNYTLGTVSTGTSAPWNTLGNTATNASVNFLGTTDAQDLVFRTANSQRMRLYNASGFVGIGNITTSSELLQVETGSNTAVSILSGTNSTLYFGTAGNHFLGAIKYDNTVNSMSFWTNTVADRIFIEGSGRVAIGNNFAVSELDVNGSLRLNGNRLFFGPVGGINSGYTGIYATASGDLRLAVFSSGAASNPPFASGGNSMDALTVKINNGFVGIGTTNPANQLHVFSPSGPSYIKVETATSTSQNGIMFKNPNREWDIINFPGGSDRISFYDATATQERLTIDGPSGNVGIGNSNPSAKLDVAGMTYFRPNGSDQTKLLVQDQLSGTAMRLYTDALAGSPYDLILGTYPNGHFDQIFLKQSNGFVGMGTNAPSSKLHVNGQITITDGTQGDGKILVSNSSGNAAWGKGTDMVAINVTSCQNIATISTTPVMFSTILASFTKLSANSVIEVTFQTDLNVEDLVGANSVRYELRVSGVSGSSNSGRANYFLDNNGSFIVASGRSVTMIGVFPTLSAGTYQVQLWASCPFGGSATNVHVDPGCFGGSSVIVKEIR